MGIESEIRNLLANGNYDISSLCRICLDNNSEGFRSLFEVLGVMSYAEKVTLCTKVQLHSDDGLPKMICEKCSAQLDIADSFRNICEHSDSILRKIFQKGDFQSDATAADLLKSEPLGNELKDEFDKNNFPIELPLGFHEVDCRDSDDFESIKVEEELPCSHSKNGVAVENGDVRRLAGLGKLKYKLHPKVKCSVCEKQLSSKYVLESHMNHVHHVSREKRKKKVYACGECGYTTPRSQALTYHVRTHTGERPYTCAECGKAFRQPGTLNNHVKLHSDKMHYTCAACGKQFKTKDNLQKHLPVHSAQAKKTCHICSKGLKTLKSFNHHMKRHYAIKDYVCTLCGFSFVTPSELNNHSVSHKQVKDFSCSVCDFSTKKKSCLKVHMKRHSGNHPFSCDHCSHSFITKGELLKHLRSHTGFKKFSCPCCDEKFKHPQSIRKHMMRKHGLDYRPNVNRQKTVIVSGMNPAHHDKCTTAYDEEIQTKLQT